MKYIVDVHENPMFATVCYSANGSPIATNVTEFEPYTEPDRKAIEDEVWGFAKEVRLEEFIDEEGRLHGYISGFNSYSEAKAKYEEWKKQKDDAVKQKVITLADEIGIHKLYAIVKEIRGE